MLALQEYAMRAPEEGGLLVGERAVDDPSPEVRAQASTMLAWQWPTAAETSVVLQRLAADDPDPEVRAEAERALLVVESLTAAQRP